MDKKKLTKIIGITAGATGVIFGGLNVIAKVKKNKSVYENVLEEKNTLEGHKVIFVKDDSDMENADGVCGHLESVGLSDYKPGIYEKYFKRAIDVVLSFGGLVVLSPVYLGISLAIIIDDPGPVLFTQKRMGQNKKYFKLHKFRSMKMCTPHDVPTHMLDNPEQYITRVGKFLRAHSLDELPQIWDIFIGNMSVIGPRPGLWNQDILTAERDKYNANDVKPGLTGWAQINGRDELEIPVKAKLDGEYVEKLGLLMDIKCFLGSVGVFAHDDSGVEGGTGEMKKAEYSNTEKINNQELIGNIGFGEPVEIDLTSKKKVLITGANSYIGESFQVFAEENYEKNFEIDTLDMLDPEWRKKDFSAYDIVYHVAGIAHADVGNVSEEVKQKYYAVNTDLSIEVARKAKEEGVKEFIFMSSMIVYGDSAPYGKRKIIDKNTVPHPANFYGDSKLQADVGVRELADANFKVIVLRPPMIYGKGSKGNYPILAKLAKKLPIFPEVTNERSMLHIDNLCEFLCQIMLIKEITNESVVLIPQNVEWTKTSDMVHEIAKVSGKKIISLKMLAPAVWIGGKIPGKIGELVNKAFGNNAYSQDMSEYEGIDYRMVDLKESVEKTEGNIQKKKPKALIVASVASMIDQFNMQNIELLLENGYDVDVACNCKEGNTISDERISELIDKLKKNNVTTYHVPIPRKVTDIKDIIYSIKFIKKLYTENGYTLMHCHSPIGSVVARVAAISERKKGMKVIYTAHGFHFYKGAPKKNWLIFYPIERICSSFTDVLITINKEDYAFAKKHMKANQVEYVPGVGIDTKKFIIPNFNVAEKKAELGLKDTDIMILSVGELNQNKNHEVVVRAISKLKNPNVYYFIAGKGDKEQYLDELAKELDVNLRLLGYRTDIIELLNTADIFAFPSFREGLSVALMGAMAAGLPCVVSRIRGNVDLIEDGINGYLCDPNDEVSFCESLKALVEGEKYKNFDKYNCQTIMNFDVHKIMKMMMKIYERE